MIFKQYTQSVEVGGIGIDAKITIEVHEDNETNPSEDFDFGNEEENAAYLARFVKGELFMGTILVRAEALGESGIDAMGACHLSSNNMFNSEPFEASVNNLLTDYAMVEKAIDELRENIKDKATMLKRLALTF